ncbi:hypothetical protein MFIFM68171_02560 [Madurella fahalii]|uniref:Uncharacterized protein n=1 Tax=Madurella fahalii TaxID=1157608 RepID=A0ABQ0G3K5_9PEZI
MVPDSYDPSVYDGLSSIADAVKKFDAVDGESLVSDSFRELFLQHNMDRTFGLALLHRHFDLSTDERLVEYHGTSIPWRQETASSHIRPTNWLLTKDGSVRSYEFYYPSSHDDGVDAEAGDPKYRPFIRAFEALLLQKNVMDLFGLCRYPVTTSRVA